MDEKNISPSLMEIKTFANVGSINTIVDHLKALEQKGYIIRHKYSKRNIEIRHGNFDNYSTVRIPLVASVGCDDLSVFTNEEYGESIEIDKNLISNTNQVVAVRAIGDSMIDAKIHTGDFILIELTEHANTGDKVAAIIGDMITVKRLEKKDNLMILWPESKDSKYKPIILSENFKIIGKVIYIIPGVSMDMTEVVPIKE